MEPEKGRRQSKGRISSKVSKFAWKLGSILPGISGNSESHLRVVSIRGNI